MISYIHNKDVKERICKEILEQLPEWFSKKDGITQYAKESRTSHLWAAVENEKTVGFIVMKETSPYTVEINVMGVIKEHQRKGIGAELFKSFYDFAKNNNYEFIQVKTVKSGKYASYDIITSAVPKIKDFDRNENIVS